ncbi:MAG: UDP-N-acetylglucosamine 1-carboxyvinyltransferase [Clostridia bacterium]|nr:UDP-N-acetylglucosamine 1-carboxyvinyltransferase [Clostridia bacterium]
MQRENFIGKNLIIDSSGINAYTVSDNLATKLRSSFFMAGALIAATGKACISYPGGCAIGKRPVDIHLKSFEKIGVQVTVMESGVVLTKNKIGGEVFLNFPSVGATENLMMAATIGDGVVFIKNAAKEPEIVDLARFLNMCGAKICGAGTDTIRIEGVKFLYGTEYTPMPDRIETGTFLLAAAITGGNIELSNCNAENISLLINKLCNNTCKIKVKNDIIHIQAGVYKKAFSFYTGPYPDFPTDLQAPTMSLCAVSDGVSIVKETVFEKRFGHAFWLNKMGADIKVRNSCAIVSGVSSLHGETVSAEDLRGGAALTLAALCAEGKTIVKNVSFIERGYCDFHLKLKSLGADIKRKK